MIYSLERFKPRERRSLDAETLEKYRVHFANTLAKYGYLRTEGNDAQFDALCIYLARWYGGKSGKADYPERGLFLYGPPGTGKTSFMRIFSGLFGVEMYTVWDLANIYAVDGARGLWETLRPLSGRPMILDDICNEAVVKSYGNEFPVLAILNQREEAFACHRAPTFFTTNSKGDEVARMYGQPGYSRIVGMCEKIRFGGPDMRRNPPQGGQENG